MKVKALNSDVTGYKRLAYGRLIDELDVDLAQGMTQIREDVQFALTAWLAINQDEFSKLLKKVDQQKIFVYEGGHHIDIVEDGVGSLGWFIVEDHPIL